MRSQDRELLEKFLPGIPVFSRVSPKFLRRIIDDFTFSRAKKDKTVVSQDDTSTDLYIILRGKVRVILTSDEGEEFVLSDQGEGDFFGEVSLIDGEPRSATVVAEDGCTFAVLRRARLLDLIKKEPMISMDLLSSLVHRLRKATIREQRLAFLDVRERLCRFFMQMVLEEGKKMKNNYFRIRKRTHKDLATRIGASRESVTKMLKTLVKEDLIREHGDSLLISPAICPDDDA